jgi:hypothetical protein
MFRHVGVVKVYTDVFVMCRICLVTWINILSKIHRINNLQVPCESWYYDIPQTYLHIIFSPIHSFPFFQYTILNTSKTDAKFVQHAKMANCRYINTHTRIYIYISQAFFLNVSGKRWDDNSEANNIKQWQSIFFSWFLHAHLFDLLLPFPDI